MPYQCKICNILTTELGIKNIHHTENSVLCDFCGILTCENHAIEIDKNESMNEYVEAIMDEICDDCYLYKFCNIEISK